MINKLVCICITEDGYNPNECFDDLEGQSALHAAAAIGSLSFVHVLIQVCTIYLINPPRVRKRPFVQTGPLKVFCSLLMVKLSFDFTGLNCPLNCYMFTFENLKRKGLTRNKDNPRNSRYLL